MTRFLIRKAKPFREYFTEFKRKVKDFRFVEIETTTIDCKVTILPLSFNS